VRKYAAKAESTSTAIATKTVTTHTIRHTTAMHLLRAGNEMPTVSYWLGHADINTTHMYVEIDMEMKRQMLQKADAPVVSQVLPWQKPDILQWLNCLAKRPELCAANRQHNEKKRTKNRLMTALNFT